MASITIFSGSFCSGEEVAGAVAGRLGCRRCEKEVLALASSRCNVAEERLLRAMHGPTAFFDRLTHERERNIACLRLALAELAREDGFLLHGFAGHLIPPRVTHVLKVCLVARFDHRVAVAMREREISEKEAERLVRRDDEERMQWTQHLFGREPYEESLYDILLPMDTMTVDEAVEVICENAGKEAVAPTPDSRRAAEDFLLAARVHLELAKLGQDVEVSAEEGVLEIRINRYVTRLEHVSSRIEAAARKVEGVREVHVAPGTRFIPPPLLRTADLGPPPRALLVDDERDFVQTLSERLQTRNLESAVVFNGEEALDFLAGEEPEVMVLDLKMPGIDGIEV
ncbi:MAG TPA: response regulator, partial [Bacteroidetes bacterium]|nr:response regulator [Bacteroidota bacterium]